MKSAAHRLFQLAAIQLATAVDIDDRIKSDPEFVADRSENADRMREEQMAGYLAQFRAAAAAFEAEEMGR